MLARSNPPAVLVTDAEPYTCRVFEAKLSKNNEFFVVSANTGSEALERAIEQAFDVLLWDMRLRDTYRLLPRLRALNPDAALILLTTDDRPTIDPEIARLDVTATLVKPFGLDTLVERIQSAIRTPQLNAPATIDLARVGQQIRIAAQGGQCVTRVMETRQDTFLVVAAPRVAAPDTFVPGLRVRVEVKGEDALYRFDSRLVRQVTAPVPCWELQMPRTIQREQRRRHDRFRLRLTALLSAREAGGEPSDHSAPPLLNEDAVISGAPIQGVTEDISLGGFALVSDRAMAVGAEIQVGFQMQGAKELEAVGKIVRSQPVLAGESQAVPRFRIGVAFEAMDAPAKRRLRSLLSEAE